MYVSPHTYTRAHTQTHTHTLAAYTFHAEVRRDPVFCGSDRDVCTNAGAILTLGVACGCRSPARRRLTSPGTSLRE